MSVPALARPPEPTEQPRLFAVPDGHAATAAPEIASGPAATLALVRAAEPTLEAVVTACWTQLASGAVTACPLCGEGMEPRWSAGAGVVGGRCGGCGTTLD